MKLACLFWFYKLPDLCENRLQILRLHNPNISIFGLYGGNVDDASNFENRLSPYLDDFYVFTEPQSSHWRWYHGDQMIGRWFTQRGHTLDWDTIFIAQWDMLIFDKLENQFATLKKDEILLSGLRPISEVDPWWYYIRPESEERREYERFISFVRNEHAFTEPPLCCEFIVVCLPRAFLAHYVEIPQPDIGFLEYKIPVYAQIFGTPFCQQHPHRPWWGDEPGSQAASLFVRALNSETQNVPLRVIEGHLASPRGRRIFHPVFTRYPLKAIERWRLLIKEIYHEEFKKRWWRWHNRRNNERDSRS